MDLDDKMTPKKKKLKNKVAKVAVDTASKMRKLFIAFGLLLLLVLSGCMLFEPGMPKHVCVTDFEQKTSEGLVTIDLEPVGCNENIMSFDFSMDTHTVDLSEIDLQAQTELIINGKTYRPMEKISLAGHHNSGQLKFKINDPPPTRFSVVIKNVSDVEERTFEWP
ncbi:MAG: hypothetical protein QW331_00870 [Candidatus Woesearchaeota archaeon]